MNKEKFKKQFKEGDKICIKNMWSYPVFIEITGFGKNTFLAITMNGHEGAFSYCESWVLFKGNDKICLFLSDIDNDGCNVYDSQDNITTHKITFEVDAKEEPILETIEMIKL